MTAIDIYKITYGMKNYFGDKKYEDLLSVEVNKDGYIQYPVYAIDNGSEYIEIATKTPIPKVIDDEVPGFGAYKVQKLETITDFQNFNDYMTWINDWHKEEYSESLANVIEYLESISEKYKETHRDDFGLLSEFNPDRERQNQTNLEKEKEKAMGIASEFMKQPTP